MFKVEINKKIRQGQLKAKNGVIKTPFFMPIATKAAVKTLSLTDLRQLAPQIILSNTFHLWLQPGLSVIKKAEGLHKLMNWSGPILTDSGGFQVFSLAKIRKVTERGVQFQSPIDGSKHFLTPEKAIDIQLALGSDIMMVLDDVVGYPVSKSKTQEAMERSVRWAERCLREKSKAQNSKLKQNPKLKIKNSKPLLFAIVQGGMYRDLREQCVKELVKMDFDGYAIGGLSVGEPVDKMFEALDWVLPLLPKDKPRYLMGVGKPEQIVEAVKRGVDMFDCVIPSREGRHGRLYISNLKSQISKPQLKTKNLRTTDWLRRKKLFYDTINVKSAKYRNNMESINPESKIPELREYSLAYLHHLFKTGEPLGQRLATLNNLEFYLELLAAFRQKKIF